MFSRVKATGTRARLAFCLRIAIAVALAVTGAMAGCSDDNALAPFTGGSGGHSGGGPVEAGPCQEGATRACGYPTRRQGKVVSCFRGTQSCENGTWGPCENGTVTEEVHAPPPAGGSRTQALGPSVDCRDNPCDPFCKIYEETPDGGLVSDADAGVLFDWTSGRLPDVPTSLVNKGLRQPCRYGADCQFNQRCQDVATPQACGHSKCRTGSTLATNCDPCVSMICAQDPSCCSNCAHSFCVEGTRLDASCGMCVAAVCAAIPSCCTTSWDAQCVAQVATSCPTASCSCRPGELEFNGRCYLENNADDWTASRNACRDRGTGWDLVSIGSQAENDFVRANVTGSVTWIGYTDNASEGNYVWSNGEATTYQNWWRDPDGGAGEDCIRIGTNGTWEDRDCTAAPLRNSVCERTGAAGCAAASTFNGNCYWLNTTDLTWQAARTACQAHGAGYDLVSIDDAAENAFVTSILAGDVAWIGLNDITTEGTFVWASGSTSTYRNWRQIEPNSFSEDCAYIQRSPGNIQDAFWFDEECSFDLPAFCEGPRESGWSQACVDRVKSTCDASCSTADPPSRAGVCVPWLPGQTDTTCSGFDLALGVPCTGGVVPVCNHGTTTAPAGIKVIHFPAGAAAFGTCNPDQTLRDDNDTCVTTAPIEPGKCVNVTCSSLTDTDELMVNPPGAAHQNECSCLGNWSIYSAGVSCGTPACSGGVSQAVFRRVNMFISFDKSGSMAGTRWNGSVAALTSFFQDPATAGLGVALEYFGLGANLTVNGLNTGDGCPGASCGVTACSNPMIPLGVLTAATGVADPQEDALIRSLAVGPGGGTPSYPALRGAYDAALARQAAAPEEYNVVIFVTDGEPAECFYQGGTAASTNQRLALEAEQMYLGSEIPTYTVCMTGANCTALDEIASRGGTGQAFTIDSANTTQVATDLKNALLAIAGSNASCVFELPNVGGFNPNASTVVYTPSMGASQNLSRQTDAGSCGAGWYFDDPLNPTGITLCPSTCSTIQADPAARIEVGLGCPQLVGSQTITEIYEGVCAPGSGPQWGFLTYNATLPGDSNVRLQMRTSNSLTDLAMASWMDVALVPPDPAVCTMGGPANCPVNLYDALSMASTVPTNARLRYVELAITLNPTSNGRFSPTLNDWDITYSCQANE